MITADTNPQDYFTEGTSAWQVAMDVTCSSRPKGDLYVKHLMKEFGIELDYYVSHLEELVSKGLIRIEGV